MTPDKKDWRILGCVSLAQLRGFQTRLLEAAKSPEAFPRAKGGLVSGLFSRPKPWLIAYEGDNGRETEVILAPSAAAAKEHAQRSGKLPAGMFSMEMLEASIAQMERTQNGQAGKDEHYATDCSPGGEMEQELAEVQDSWSPEKRARELARYERAMRKVDAGVIK